MGEEDDLADRVGVDEEHGQPVDAHAKAAGRRHSIAEGFEIGLVDRMGLVVAVAGPVGLVDKALQLVDRVVDLAERVADFHPDQKPFKPFDLPRVVGGAFGQRADIARVVDQKGRLDQIWLDMFGHQAVDQLAPAAAGIWVVPKAAHCIGQAGRIGVVFIVDAGRVQDRLAQRDTPPGGGQIDRLPLPGQQRTSVDLLGDKGDQLLGAAHHILIVGVGLVKLQLGKFRVVFETDAFVAEVTPDFIDAVVAAGDQPFEIELEADAQIEILVQLVVVGHKGSCSCAAVERLQDGGFDLQKAFVVQIGAHRPHDGGPGPKEVAHRRVGQQVDGAAPVAFLRVTHAVPLVWHRFERLAKKLDLLDLDTQLASLGHDQRASRPDKIPQVDQPLPDNVVKIAGQRVAAQHQLERTAPVFKIGKTHLAHDPDPAQPAGDRDRLSGLPFPFVQGPCGGDRMGAAGTRRIGVDPGGAQPRQIFETGHFLVGQGSGVKQRMGRFAHRLPHRHNLKDNLTARRLDNCPVTDPPVQQGPPHRAFVADLALARVCFGRAHDRILLFLVEALLPHNHGPADRHDARCGVVVADHLGILQNRLQLANAPLQKSLGRLGLVVASILADVPFRFGFGDHLGDLAATHRRQILQLVFDLVQTFWSQKNWLVVAHCCTLFRTTFLCNTGMKNTAFARRRCSGPV